MAITVPTSWSALDLDRIRPAHVLRGEDLRAIIRAQHHEYSRRGVRAPLVLREDPWQTASATLTQTDTGSAGVDLDVEQAVLRLERVLLVSSAESVQLTGRLFGARVEAEVTIFAPDGNTTLGTLTLTQSGGSTDWAKDTLTLTSAQADAGGVAGAAPRVLLASIKAKASSGTASLYQVHLHASLATASEMP